MPPSHPRGSSLPSPPSLFELVCHDVSFLSIWSPRQDSNPRSAGCNRVPSLSATESRFGSSGRFEPPLDGNSVRCLCQLGHRPTSLLGATGGNRTRTLSLEG